MNLDLTNLENLEVQRSNNLIHVLITYTILIFGLLTMSRLIVIVYKIFKLK